MGYISELNSPCLTPGNSRNIPHLRKSADKFLSKHRNAESADRQWYHSKFIRRLENEGSRIEKETPVVPSVIAKSVVHEASFWLGEMLPPEWITDLAVRAEVIYAQNPRFRQLLRARGNSGRDWLWAFTRHWLSGLLVEHRPSLAARLPSEYKVGHPLPSAVP